MRRIDPLGFRRFVDGLTVEVRWRWRVRRGSRVLSASKPGKSEGNSKSAHSATSSKSSREPRKQRSGDLGRALRSVYDDTLRESIPDDFLNLLGKLD
jgi:hypothetical protein